MEDEALVEAVRKFECLWKVNSRIYKDIRAKENAWKAVASSTRVHSHLLDLLASREWVEPRVEIR